MAIRRTAPALRGGAVRSGALVVCLLGCAGGADAAAAPPTAGSGGTTMMGVAGDTGTGGATGTGGMTAAASGPPTFTRVWTEVLQNKGCSGTFCHGMGIGMLRMDNSAIAYASLVGVAAAGPKCGTSGKLRVVAGDPDNSLLLDKISHDPPACGDIMPLGAKLDPMCISNSVAVCNTATEIDLVRAWIAAGAAND